METASPVRSAETREYRSDIDVLRAVAVLLVIAYHWEVRPFRGGYVGVDIFFVISGFLITKIIVDEHELGRFSPMHFYVRRVRRLAPALLLVLTATFSAGWVSLSPKGLQEASWGILAALSFTANVLFWSRSDYFAGDAAENPLLHTWSLSVEEQFYLIYPLLLILGIGYLRLQRQHLVVALIAGLVCSLVVSVVMTYASREAAFFLLPARAWELLLGAGLAAARLPAPSHDRLRRGLGAAGWVMIVIAATTYSRRTSFPGFAALLPCTGVALIIAMGTGRTAWGQGFSLLAALGRISYGAYLWHWPLYVFAVHMHDGARLGPLVKLLILGLTFALAFVSYRLLERPCRDARRVGTARLLTVVAAASLALVVASSSSILFQGIPGRFPAALASIARYENYPLKELYRQHSCWLMPDDDPSAYDAASCTAGDARLPTLVLWGDSIGAHYARALQADVAESRRTIQATAAACPPFFSIAPSDSSNAHCGAFNGRVLDLLDETRPATVVLAGHWQAYALSLGLEAFVSRLQATARQITQQHAHAVIIGPPVQFNATLPSLIYKYGIRGLSAAKEPWLEARGFPLDSRMRQAFEGMENVTYISVLDEVCRDRICPVFAPSGVPIAWDTVHLTAEGSRLVLERIRPHLQQALDR